MKRKGFVAMSEAPNVDREVQPVRCMLRNMRRMYWIVGIQIVAIVLFGAGLWENNRAALLLELIYLAASVGLCVSILGVMRALGASWVFQLLAALCLVPVMSPLVVIVVNEVAVDRLKTAGLRVGLVGVSDQEFKRWRESRTHPPTPPRRPHPRPAAPRLAGGALHCPSCWQTYIGAPRPDGRCDLCGQPGVEIVDDAFGA